MDTTATDMAMATATTDKFLLLFSAVESSVQTKNLDHLVLVLNFKILNKLLDKELLFYYSLWACISFLKVACFYEYYN